MCFVCFSGGYGMGWSRGTCKEACIKRRKKKRFCTKKVGSQKGDNMVATFTKLFHGFIYLTRVPQGIRENTPSGHFMRHV